MNAPLRRLTLLAVAVLAVAAPAPATATTDRYAVVTQDSNCAARPDWTFSATTSALSEGEVVAVAQSRQVDGYAWTRLARGRQPCWVSGAAVTSVLPGPLDPSEWTGTAIVVDPEGGLIASEVLTGSDQEIKAAPSNASTILRDAAAGEVLTAAPWSVTGDAGLGGTVPWTPVSVAGAIGWIKARSIASVPDLAMTDLTAVLTPERDVTVYGQPTTSAELLGTLMAEDEAPALLTPTAGWLPVSVDDQVGWVSQEDLVGAEEVAPTEAAVPGEPGLVLDSALDEYEAWQSERDAAQDSKAAMADDAASPGWLEGLRAKVTGENPVAEAAARARLLIAAGVGLLALLLASVAAAVSRDSLTGRVSDMVAPGGRLLASWGAVATAPIAALIAAGLAPSTYFQGQVISGALLVGLLVGAALGLRLAGNRSVLAAHVRETSTVLLMFAAASGAVAHLVLGAPFAVATVASLLAAGLLAGIRARAVVPAHPPVTDRGSSLAVQQEDDPKESL